MINSYWTHKKLFKAYYELFSRRYILRYRSITISEELVEGTIMRINGNGRKGND